MLHGPGIHREAFPASDDAGGPPEQIVRGTAPHLVLSCLSTEVFWWVCESPFYLHRCTKVFRDWGWICFHSILLRVLC